MKNLNFNPEKALTVCDVCGAMCIGFGTGRTGVTLTSTVEFSCGSMWTASRRANFNKDTFPDGEYDAYDKYLGPWKEASDCGNAVEVVRQARKEKT